MAGAVDEAGEGSVGVDVVAAEGAGHTAAVVEDTVDDTSRIRHHIAIGRRQGGRRAAEGEERVWGGEERGEETK